MGQYILNGNVYLATTPCVNNLNYEECIKILVLLEKCVKIAKRSYEIPTENRIHDNSTEIYIPANIF